MSDKLRPATKARPCPVCSGDHKCSTSADGLILCGRTKGPVPGFRHLGTARNPVWDLYRPDADPGPAPPEVMPAVARVTAPPPPPPPPPPPDFPALSDWFAAHLTPELADKLAARLRLPNWCLAHVPDVGFDPADGSFTFPEVDGLGRVCGILKRRPDDAKRQVDGSRRGVVASAGWADRPGPVFVVEGPTDVLALAACGLAAVGRPSNRGGVDALLGLLGPLDPARPVVVVGENDQKPDGQWPGKDGARAVADGLAAGLGRAVKVAMPPPVYKDVRDWVADQATGDGFDFDRLGRDVARDLVGNAADVSPPARGGRQDLTFGGKVLPRRWPLPVRIGDLPLPGPDGVAWVWDGFLARDAVTLISALPKGGKTTLFGYLLAALPAGGVYCGRPLSPGRAVVVSEEPAGAWAARRDKFDIPPDPVRLFTRGVVTRAPSLDEWEGFLAHLGNLLAADPADLVIFDTLSNLWPVRDENSAAEVTAALAPLHRLCLGRSVVVVHHLRKSDGGEGTGSRGSGALAGFVDVILEYRRQKVSLDPKGRRRVLTGYGRYDRTPAEWVVELEDLDPRFPATDGGRGRMVHVPGGAGGGDRDVRVRAAVLGLLQTDRDGGGPGLTRKQLWDGLPAELRVNEKVFREVLEDGCGSRWTKEERNTRAGGDLFRPVSDGPGD